MEEWEPVRRAGQEVKGIDPNYSGLVIVEVTLSPAPPPDWVALWSPYPPNSTYHVNYGPPKLHGSRATLRVPEDKVKTAVEALDGQIAAANAWYEQEVIPRIEAAEKRQRQEQADEQRRIDSARSQLDELDRPA